MKCIRATYWERTLKITLKFKRDSEKKLTELFEKKERLYAEKKQLNREILELQRLLKNIDETVVLLEKKREARIVKKNLLKGVS